MGRRHGRRRAYLSQREHRSALRRHRAGQLFHAQPERGADARLYEDLVDINKTAIWPVRPTRGVNRGYREELLRADGSAAYYTGVSSPMIYRGDRLPKELQGNAFVVDSPTNLVHRL